MVVIPSARSVKSISTIVGKKYFTNKGLVNYKKLNGFEDLPIVFGDNKSFEIFYNNLVKIDFPINKIKKLQKSLVIKNPNEADDLYLKALKETENADDFYKSLSVTNPNIMDPMTPLKVSKTGFDKIDSSLNTLRGLRVVEDQALFGNLKGFPLLVEPRKVPPCLNKYPSKVL